MLGTLWKLKCISVLYMEGNVRCTVAMMMKSQSPTLHESFANLKVWKHDNTTMQPTRPGYPNHKQVTAVQQQQLAHWDGYSFCHAEIRFFQVPETRN